MKTTGAVATSFQVGLYLSKDNVITTTDAQLAVRHVFSLAANSTSTGATTVTVPIGLE